MSVAGEPDPPEDGERIGFAVTADGVAHPLILTPALDAAFDILTDAGYGPTKVEEILTGAARLGLDPERFARKMAHLRSALR